jgi:FHA domain-containing protein/uncharacterized protein DUF1707
MDSASVTGENPGVLGHGASRRQIARVLNAAYADGLLSEDTFTQRLDQALGARLVDPVRLIGDLTVRAPQSWRARLNRTLNGVSALLTAPGSKRVRRDFLLALDWSGGQRELIVGRHRSCDVVLSDPSVSRRHARLVFRDGSWVLQDLESTNGTLVNGEPVGRCALRPGDRLALGDQQLRID